MKWLDRLRQKNSAPSPDALTKLPKGGSVGFVSAPPGNMEVFTRRQDFSHAASPPPADLIGDDPCPTCGSQEKWRWLDGRLVCRPCLIAGDAPVTAVKVWSDILDEAVWVVANDLPQADWPADAPVYTHAEVKRLLQVGREPLAWVHVTKQMFNAHVVSAGRRFVPANAPAHAEEGR